MTATLDGTHWRSLLFVPGARADRYAKAMTAGADLVCIDLEDATAPADKASARDAALTFVAGATDRTALLGIRVNAVGTPEGAADLAVIGTAPGLDFVMVPKPSGPEDMSVVADAFGRPALIPVLESARAILRADAIADHPAVVAGIYGAIDLSADVGCTLDWEPHLYGRSRCALAFAAARKTLFDVPYLDVRDPEGLVRETRRARSLGLSARAAIHPDQVAGIHEALRPSAEEVARATRIVAAFEAAPSGLALLDGKLIELPVIKSARRVLALAARG